MRLSFDRDFRLIQSSPLAKSFLLPRGACETATNVSNYHHFRTKFVIHTNPFGTNYIHIDLHLHALDRFPKSNEQQKAIGSLQPSSTAFPC